MVGARQGTTLRIPLERSAPTSFKRVLGRTSSRGFIEHHISLNLQKSVRIDEARYLHDRVGRTDVTEELTVHRRDGLPVLNSGEQDTGADDVPE